MFEPCLIHVGSWYVQFLILISQFLHLTIPLIPAQGFAIFYSEIGSSQHPPQKPDVLTKNVFISRMKASMTCKKKLQGFFCNFKERLYFLKNNVCLLEHKKHVFFARKIKMTNPAGRDNITSPLVDPWSGILGG